MDAGGVMRLGLRHRPYLLVAAGVGLVLGVIAHGFIAELANSLLLGWCGAAVTHMALTGYAMTRATPESIRRRAEQLDEGETAVLCGSLAAAIASLGGVMWYLVLHHDDAGPFEISLAIGTIAISWTFVQMLFAVRYAHEYWQQDGGLDFPGKEPPDFTDFLYFAFTIGMTFQTSDVDVSARDIRRLTLVHALVSFLFNVVIVAMTVNLTSGLVK
ncbi:DUF1345 domain-containing protein [Plastoroseomonas arctica]|uniref:DUF1345 domain-containing protein n=1 Tax=Plastoroseomonas arctica TaxID=1509237 RepID=A0AAF1K5G9_9PROT|nr:DUF1345 domain-containing protein [Plastoroseomonas arctica]MBR0656525.1 DUF1345 domain-containing protein [Plastoroseomonas arctica]